MYFPNLTSRITSNRMNRVVWGIWVFATMMCCGATCEPLPEKCADWNAIILKLKEFDEKSTRRDIAAIKSRNRNRIEVIPTTVHSQWESYRDYSALSKDALNVKFSTYVDICRWLHLHGFILNQACFARTLIDDSGDSELVAEGRQMLERLSVSGDFRAMYELGKLHCEQRFPDSSLARGEELLWRSAKAGLNPALHFLFTAYKHGELLPKDRARALLIEKISEDKVLTLLSGAPELTIFHQGDKLNQEVLRDSWTDEEIQSAMVLWKEHLLERIANGDANARISLFRLVGCDGYLQNDIPNEELEVYALEMIEWGEYSHNPFLVAEKMQAAAWLADYYYRQPAPIDLEKVAYYACFARGEALPKERLRRLPIQTRSVVLSDDIWAEYQELLGDAAIVVAVKKLRSDYGGVLKTRSE